MASSPTSRLRFLDRDGAPIDAPREWAPGFVEVDCELAAWESIELRRNGRALSLAARKLAGRACILADWPLSPAGTYELELIDGAALAGERLLCTVVPAKLSPGELETMVGDLQQQLPAEIAIALQRGGARVGVELVPPLETTLADELRRLKVAVEGDGRQAGLSAILRQVGRQPHHVLRHDERWTPSELAQRVDPLRLTEAYRRPGNLDQAHVPVLLPDQRVQPSYDVYENRLLKAFCWEVDLRLARVVRWLRGDDLVDEAHRLLLALRASRRAAAFLDPVGELAEPPSRVSMVLGKRPDYRAAFDAFIAFRRRALVQLHEPAVDAPLENVPFLYQTWCVLEIVRCVLEILLEAGFAIQRQRLATRVGAELWIRLVPDGLPALVLEREGDGTRISVIPQRSYAPSAAGLHSVSFRQIPDVAIERLDAAGNTDVTVFDPKYKLQSETNDGLETDGRPKKVDVDAMHAYRDAIRDGRGQRVVSFAAVLYPGPHKEFDRGLAAIQARPASSAKLRERLRPVLEERLLAPGGASP